ncbi:hypothetical protein CEE37_01960 [candidate division LCP-89 bacterium B3_LCP]|uniref:Uncharacterized protein n=1 Tax=candidate division LCP-89 bacterium B3_LCP TaxID=2012998 RepID=A0A532V5R4_UNCL8|nr:MAG: hypothetical protein CEE37_01960 [candidate division LCP-89 bacterium B3_LCP]
MTSGVARPYIILAIHTDLSSLTRPRFFCASKYSLISRCVELANSFKCPTTKVRASCFDRPVVAAISVLKSACSSSVIKILMNSPSELEFILALRSG